MAQNDRDQQKAGSTQQGSTQQGSQQGTTQQGTTQQRAGGQGIQQTGMRPGGGELARRGAGGALGMPSAVASPFSFVRRMMEDMDRLFGDFGVPGQSMSSLMRGLDPMSMLEPMAQETMAMWAPRMEIFEEQGQLAILADLPGLKRDEIRIDLQDDMLVISGERRDERREQREGAYLSERSYGRFSRAIRLPEGVDPNSIDARFENGVLDVRVKLPQRQQQGRQITIKGSGNGG